ncbi:kinetochore protein NDC80 homolog [Maniola hyperantus]|uniref:kinetochore protein NDC80 homolog n=1 Tax=Aphantopus hyperantus TaxID=2795564 RepID=UPI0015689AA6|nr:kinetochore protein NDC80 homolog [Maniola hyperantus]
MMPTRYAPGHSSAIRKSRLDSKPSLLPVRRQGSTDRTSTEARRPSTTGARSSSAEPARGTIGVPRLSKDASVTKLSTGRARSQTGEYRYGSTTTPLRSSQYSTPTTTPSRTPEDRLSRNWETCLERALAFVTVKDKRQISNVAWQRAEQTRVSAALGARGMAGAPLLRPLTIARFIDIVNDLLASIIGDVKLSNESYVTKLPHLAKRLLYPSPVSKSWLRTVNTLHAFPQALALIGYLLDLATHCQMPMSDDWLFISRDEVSCLRRDYLNKCWIRFQDPPGNDFRDLNEDYLRGLRALFGDDDDKILQLEQEIKEYDRRLEDTEELAARAEEARRVERRDALLAALRSVRGARRGVAADVAALRTAGRDHAEQLRVLDSEIERASAAIEQLRVELEQQPISVEERTALLDEVDYATRVHDSKRALAKQISKMLASRESELAQWQKSTLDACVEYKQLLICLGAQLPALAHLAVDEKELMDEECAVFMARAVETLREEGARLAAKKAELLRSRSMLGRKRAVLLEETRNKIADMKSCMQREQQALDAENAKESSDAAAWSRDQQQTSARLEQLRANREEHAKVAAELAFWEKQDAAWRAKLGELRAYVSATRARVQQRACAVRESRAARLRDTLALWRDKLDC